MENTLVFKILIIDDQEDNLISIQAIIKEYFPKSIIQTAISGMEGIRLAVEIRPDVILLDIRMPNMDGYEVCQTIRNSPEIKDTPVIFLTTLIGDKASRLHALEVGGDAFLGKPIDESELFAQIITMLRIKRASDEKQAEKERLKQLVAERTNELILSNRKTLKLLETIKKENTTRKKTEQALLEAQEIAHIGNWELDLKTKIITASKESFRIFGIDRDLDSIPLEQEQALVAPEYRSYLDQKLDNLIHNNQPYDAHFELVQENSGNRVVVHSHAIIQRDESGNPLRIVGTIQDVTDFERTQTKLTETQQRLESIIKATNVGIWEWDILSNHFFSNERLTRMLGYELNEFPNQREERFSLINPEDFPILEKHLNNLFEHRENQYSIEYRMKHKNGSWVWIHDLGNVISWSIDGTPLKMAGTHTDITERKNAEILLKQSEERFRVLFENAPFGYQSLDETGHFIEVNKKWLSIFGFKKNEVIGKWFGDFVQPDQRENFSKRFDSFKKQGSIYSEFPMNTKDGRVIIVGFDGNIGFDANHKFKQTHCTVRDITEINLANEKLRTSENQYHSLVSQMPLGLVVHEIILDEFDHPINYRFLSCNEAYSRQIGFSESEIIGKTVKDIFPNTEDYWIEIYGKVALTGIPCVYENYSSELARYFKVTAYSTERKQFAVIVEDITIEKMRQMEIEYLSEHDFLTGLFNRRHFVNAFKNLDDVSHYPLGIMMIDVNGLKIINDAFGHDIGDIALIKLSNVLKNSFRENDVLARIGGDEFAVILPNTTLDEIEVIKESIKKMLIDVTVENVELSIATGYDIKDSSSHQDLDDILKVAENHMYRHKLTEGISTRNHAIRAILKTLTDKYVGERIHSMKVSYLCKRIGEELNLKKEDVKELELAGMYHDIGKISIPDAILNKPGKLTKEEFAIIKSHSEISYQILRAADEYSDLAIHALHHHEHWDGSGYPSGQSGAEIPLFSRIISIADAYEAMTAIRPYKKQMSETEAAKEIARCAGIQFDPDIAQVFVEQVLHMDWKSMQ